MQKWEYLVVTRVSRDNVWLNDKTYVPLGDYLNAVGKEGWELVTHTFLYEEGGHATIILKRPLN